MLNSTTLEVAIGMALIYLLLSLLCTAVNEAIAGLLGARGVVLEKGIRNLFTEGTMQTRDAAGNLLTNPDGTPVLKPLSDLIYEHGLIQSLYRSGSGQLLALSIKRNVLPSYIPSRTFASALFDLLFPATGSSPLSLDSMLTDVKALPPSCARQALLTMIREAGGDAVKTRRAFENWYNDAMDRVSGYYKRQTQAVLFAIGLALALLLNINSIEVARTLWSTPALRSYAITLADQYGQKGISTPPSVQTLSNQLHDLEAFGLPLGWNPKQWPWQEPAAPARDATPTQPATPAQGAHFSGWVLGIAIFGWAITAVSTTLGAPFWFDLLNQFMVVRSTVKPSEKSDTEASKDPV